MKQWIILNYDFGLRGDYENLYRFLDNHEAIECGTCNAVFEYEINSSDNFDDIMHKLKSELGDLVNIDRNDRIYAITFDKNYQGIKGRFLFGSRKRAVWEGYRDIQSNDEDKF